MPEAIKTNQLPTAPMSADHARTVKVAIAQINATVGDFDGNLNAVLEACATANQQGADILLTPELAISGYPPEDLLFRAAFFYQCAGAINRLLEASRAWPNLHIVVGVPTLDSSEPSGSRHDSASSMRCHNSALLICHGQVKDQYHKRELPNYTVFDEKRYFTPGASSMVFTVGGTTFGVNICEDTWFAQAPAAAKKAGAQVLLVLNASPYHMGKEDRRFNVMRERVLETDMPLVYAHVVGGQDELIFDGASFVMNRAGEVTTQLAQFATDFEVVHFIEGQPQAGTQRAFKSLEGQVYDALVLGVQDYVGKNGFPGAVIGLSGGIDSALTLAIAVDALGADRVRTVMMQSPYTADISWIDARDMAQRVGVRYDEISIKGLFDNYLTTLQTEFAGRAPDTAEENIQARIRGTLLMALSNKFGSIVLTTGNKSEMATGYCTLYGDMAGGFAVIKDIAKTLVVRLCRYRNSISVVIPERIIVRPPSAELRADQKDQDSLPPYEVLDAIIQLYMEDNGTVEDIVASGFDLDTVRKVVRLIKLNEYKRRQAPVGIRVTHRAFGRDWRYPITSKFRE
jgi:NAD+ synthase (glutamine-hydrolysing)